MACATPPRRSICPWLAAVLLLPGWLCAQATRIDRSVPAALQSSGTALVSVVLKDSSERRQLRRRRGAAFRQAQDGLLERLDGAMLKVRHRFRYSPTLLLEVSDAATLARLDADPAVESVTLEATGSGALHQSRALIAADEVFELGYRGDGRVVAVLDTGVETDHPDLQEAIVHQYHILGAGANTGKGAEDGHGHGTNVCGIIASRGTVAPRGVAPGALLAVVKILDNQNRGFLSDWAKGVEHIIELNEAEDGIRIDAINMSLVSDEQYPGACDGSHASFAAACEAAMEDGIAVFASSGNTGSSTRMTAPACFGAVISVGSTADTGPGNLSSFTSRTDNLDLLAPGQSITSTGVGGGTSTFTGTSQACPHAVACAAVLRGIEPGLAPTEVERLLEATGVAVSDFAVDRTFPRLHLLAAVEAATAPADCNGNGRADTLDIVLGTSLDVDANGIPDECLTPVVAFQRGDANASSDIDISDAVTILLQLFADTALDCADASDANDDGDTDISDPIFLLDSLFRSGNPLPEPTHLCGPDPTSDELDCTDGGCG